MVSFAQNLILDSHPKNIAEIEPFVVQTVRQYDINEDLFGNMLITLTEAVSNAILHGNRARLGKKVSITTQYSAKKIVFSVSDEGNGFDHNLIPDPTSPENIAVPGGRGVFLMQQLCDAVFFHDGGRTVELEFTLG